MTTTFSILCGGSGSRLWPDSTDKTPKQLLCLTNEYSMLQNTILRVNKFPKKHYIQIICNKNHINIVSEQINKLNIKNIQIIVEPIGRDSAPAVCMSAYIKNENDYTFIVPCDHVFDDDEFINCCVKSLDYIDNSLITFGIKPSRIETGYGYIKILDENLTERFVEKPNYELAKNYFESGQYYWNAGVFGFKNINMINCFSTYAPEILESCKNTILNSFIHDNIIYLDELIFTHCKSISFDYAIVEKLCNDENKSINMITIKYNSKWNDIGSYSALYDELQKDDNNNVINGNVVNFGSKNCYISGNKKIIATIGLNNIVIVDTDDGLLICNKDYTQDVKKVVDYLKNKHM